MTTRILTDAELAETRRWAEESGQMSHVIDVCDALLECRAVIRKALSPFDKPGVDVLNLIEVTPRTEFSNRVLHALGIDPEQVPSAHSGQGGGRET